MKHLLSCDMFQNFQTYCTPPQNPLPVVVIHAWKCMWVYMLFQFPFLQYNLWQYSYSTLHNIRSLFLECMYVNVCECMWVCIFLQCLLYRVRVCCPCVCMYACKIDHIHAFMHVHSHVNMYVCTSRWIHVCIYVTMHICRFYHHVNVCMHVFIHW